MNLWVIFLSIVVKITRPLKFVHVVKAGKQGDWGEEGWWLWVNKRRTFPGREAVL